MVSAVSRLRAGAVRLFPRCSAGSAIPASTGCDGALIDFLTGTRAGGGSLRETLGLVGLPFPERLRPVETLGGISCL
ncbi:MAG: hypothetical protein L0170_15200, partial [Acidobacteria bacterium]|nr:hypothetical protein [Acidobacteriota bacterium]